jgi:TonB family protein
MSQWRSLNILIVPIVFATAAFSVYGQASKTQSASTGQELTVEQREARDELNRSAAAYRVGRFAEAQQHSERALALDPANRTAQIFLARILHQRFKPGDDNPENVEMARSAILAYQRILSFDSSSEEAYKAVAVLYASIREEQLLRDWIWMRASNSLVSVEKRAEAYAILAGKDWDCSFKITELPENKLVDMKGNSPVVVFKKPKSALDFEKAKLCVTRGLEMSELAIALDANSEAAWSYKTNLLIEQSKLAEMDGQEEVKTACLKAANEAQAEATRLAEKRHREEEEGELTPQESRPQPPVRLGAESKERQSPPTEPPSGKIVPGGDLNNAAVNKPEPIYPQLAKSAGASGIVRVEIVVSESGDVISARAVSGHPLLQAAAVAAARRAKFTPISIQNEPVNVRGFLTYEFRPQ